MLDRAFEIISNKELAPLTYELTLSGSAGIEKPGQFINIALSGFYLRRPISLCDWDESGMTLIYKAVGQGTDALSRMETGDMLDILNGPSAGNDAMAGLLIEQSKDLPFMNQ